MKNIKYFKEVRKDGTFSLSIVDVSTDKYQTFYSTLSIGSYESWNSWLKHTNNTIQELTADEFQTAMIELKK